MGAPRRQRQSVERYSIVKRACGFWRMLRDEPQDRCQMEGAARYVGSTLRSEGHVFNHPVSTEEEAIIVALHRHPSAASGWLPLCATGDDSTPDAFFTASLSSAPWDQSPTRNRRRQIETVEVQELSDRLFHIDIAEVQTAEDKLRLFIAIDRTSKFAYIELHQQAGKIVAVQFLRRLIGIVSYKIHTILTENGIAHRFDEGKTPVD